MATMHLEIFTGEQILFEGDVDVVVAPGTEGELTILPHHATLMTTLQSGELRYKENGSENYVVLTGGFMQVALEAVTVMADAAERAEDIDEVRAQQAMERSQERIAQRGTDMDLERALSSLRRAQMRLEVVKRRRRRGPGVPERESIA